MIKIFILILLAFLIWPVVKMLFYLFNAHRFVKRQQESFRKAYSQAYGNAERQNPDSGRRRSPRKKVFSKSDGEYVEFEEIACERADSSESTANYVREEQVSDAEWTELK